MIKIYGLYKGDQFLTSGTKYQLANYLKVKLRTIEFYLTPTYKKRCKGSNKRLNVIYLGDD